MIEWCQQLRTKLKSRRKSVPVGKGNISARNVVETVFVFAINRNVAARNAGGLHSAFTINRKIPARKKGGTAMNVGGLDYVIMAKTSLSARIVVGADFVRMGKKNVILAVLVFGSIIRGSPSTDNHYTNEKWCSSQTNSVSHYLQSFPRIPIDKRVIARPRLKISYYCLSPLSQTLRACNLLISNSPHQKEHLGPV